MRKFAMGVFLVAVLAGVLITSTYAATVSIEVNISQDLNVVFQFIIDNETIYTNLKTHPQLMNETTVPETIRKNYAVTYSDANITYPNDTSHSIRSTFHLTGQSVINSTIERSSSVENFQISTKWRKFFLNITKNFSFNFTHDLATPLTQWANIPVNGITSFSFSNSTKGVSCTFELPSSATNILRIGETISFDVPYQIPWADNVIDSPILILIGLVIVGGAIFVYRKVR